MRRVRGKIKELFAFFPHFRALPIVCVFFSPFKNYEKIICNNSLVYSASHQPKSDSLAKRVNNRRSNRTEIRNAYNDLVKCW